LAAIVPAPWNATQFELSESANLKSLCAFSIALFVITTEPVPVGLNVMSWSDAAVTTAVGATLSAPTLGDPAKPPVTFLAMIFS
jgi:hypothetical protein